MLRTLPAFDFDSVRRNELIGRLPEVQSTFSEFVAGYLRAVLEATSRPTDGKIQIHPAMKMATGNEKLTASQAADIVKRLLKPMAPLTDPVLREAYETALRLRPRQQKSRKGRG